MIVPNISNIFVEYLNDLSGKGFREMEQPTEFRFSQIGQCHNRLVLEWLYERQRDYSNTIRPGFGTLWHELLENTFAELFDRKPLKDIDNVEIEWPCEWSFKTKYGSIRVSGTADMIVETPDSTGVVDFKTVGDFSFGKQSEELDRTYLWQLMGYMHSMKAQWGKIVLVNLNGDLHDVDVRYDQKIVKQIKRHLSSVFKQRRIEEHGEREYTNGKFPCTYCPFRQECWEMDPDEVDGIYRVENISDEPLMIQESIRQLRLFNQRAQSSQVEADACKGRAHNAALQLLKSTKSRKAIIPGLGVVQLWGRTVRIKND